MQFSFWQAAGKLLCRRKADPALFRWILVSSGFANILGLASSIYAIQIFNRYVAYGLDGTLITLTVGAVLAIFLEFTFKWIRARLSAALLQPQEALDYDDLLVHLNETDASAIHSQQADRIRSVMRFQQRLAEIYSPANFITLLGMPFALLFLLAVLLLNPVLGVLALLICGACFAMARWHGDNLMSVLTEQREKQQQLDVMVGNAEAVNIVRAHSLHSVVQCCAARKSSCPSGFSTQEVFASGRAGSAGFEYPVGFSNDLGGDYWYWCGLCYSGSVGYW